MLTPIAYMNSDGHIRFTKQSPVDKPLYTMSLTDLKKLEDDFFEVNDLYGTPTERMIFQAGVKAVLG